MSCPRGAPENSPVIYHWEPEAPLYRPGGTRDREVRSSLRDAWGERISLPQPSMTGLRSCLPPGHCPIIFLTLISSWIHGECLPSLWGLNPIKTDGLKPEGRGWTDLHPRAEARGNSTKPWRTSNVKLPHLEYSMFSDNNDFSLTKSSASPHNMWYENVKAKTHT
jgi:hypothetical protein